MRFLHSAHAHANARRVATGMTAALLIFGACGSDKKAATSTTATTTAPTTAPAAAGAALTIEGFAFSELTVKAGETFTITNKDAKPHTVTADDASFGVPVDADGTAQLSIAKPGTYAIHCDIHASMHGTIVVN